ncbi:MAG: hypothetical protein QOD07_1602 [Frankiaceae bacterium]|jgi:hypothetical protein|nr:hypothetical protein [Frankiaceae bacterium]
MRATTKRTIVAVAIVGLTAGVIPAAHAGVRDAKTRVLVGVAPLSQSNSAGDTIHGGCFMVAVEDPTSPDTYHAEVGDASVTTDAKLVPTGASVTCNIDVNGIDDIDQPHFTGAQGVQGGAETEIFVAGVGDAVLLCETVLYADGTTQPKVCTPVTDGPEVPPQAIADLLPPTADLVRSVLHSEADPLACPVLASFAGSIGPFTIGPDGDVYAPDPLDLGLNPVYDCPPYSDF